MPIGGMTAAAIPSTACFDRYCSASYDSFWKGMLTPNQTMLF
jgi:hypothetical protein